MELELRPNKRPSPQEHVSRAYTQAELVAERVNNRVLTDRIKQLCQDKLALTAQHERLKTDSGAERAMTERNLREANNQVLRLQTVLKENEALSNSQQDEMQRLRNDNATVAQHKLTLLARIRDLRAELEVSTRATLMVNQVDIREVEEEGWKQAQVRNDLLKLENKLRTQQQTFEKEKHDMQEEICKLREAMRSKEDQSIETLQEEMEKLEVSCAQRTEDLKTEIKILRGYNANLEHEKRTIEQTLQTAQQEVVTAQDKVSALEEDLDEQKRLHTAAIKSKEVLTKQGQVSIDDSRERAELKRTSQLLTDERDRLAKKVKDMSANSSSTAFWQDAAKASKAAAKNSNDKLREALQTQHDLELLLSQHAAETAQPKLAPPRASSKKAVKAAEKQTRAATEARVAADRRVDALAHHYDALHSKNCHLVGKLTAMAQVGGFGNHGSIYRRELDALRGLPLEHLDVYKELRERRLDA